jgi:hypothetical protein
MSKNALHSSSCKTFKTLRIKKKKPKENLSSTEESFIDEDPSNFFSQIEEIDLSKSLDQNGNFKPRSFIGPSPSSKSPIPKLSEIKRLTQRGPSIRLPLPQPINHEKRFQEILLEIQKNKQKSENQEKIFLKNLSPREKIITNRQRKILENFDKKRKYWKNLEKSLSEKTLKPTDKLLSSLKENDFIVHDALENHIQENFYWYLNLRTKDVQNSKTFVPLGSGSQGLFTCIKGKTTESPGYSPKPSDVDELQVVGLGKFSLEVEAVKSKGKFLLDPELIDRKNYDEVLVQHYERRYQASKL